MLGKTSSTVAGRYLYDILPLATAGHYTNAATTITRHLLNFKRCQIRLGRPRKKSKSDDSDDSEDNIRPRDSMSMCVYVYMFTYVHVYSFWRARIPGALLFAVFSCFPERIILEIEGW